MSEFNKKDFQSIPVTRFELLDKIEVDSRFTPVKIWIAHTGKNLNKSNFSKERLTAMIPSLTGVPIVGFVEADNANKVDFKGHEERYIVSVDGVEIEYLGRAYGFIPENNDAKFELKTVDGVEREYLTANGLIWNKFSKAKEILDRDVFKAQSMELERESLEGSYSKKDDEYVVTNAKFEALCMLGSNKLPAMVGGLIEKFQFTAIKFELQEMLEEMKLELKKGDAVLDITKFEELLADYSYVSKEFAEDIKSKLESYETEEALVEVLKSENAVQYALTVEAKMKMLRKEVYEIEVYRDDYGYVEHRYSMRDASFEAMEVYCTDYKDWSDVGFTFIANGDEFEIDEESKFQIAWQPVRVNEATEDSPMFSLAVEVKSAYEFGVKSIDELKSAQETISTFEADKLTHEEAVKNYESQLEELNSLREYKASIETQVKKDYVSSIENLTDLEKQDISDNVDKYSLVELQDEIAKVVGKKSLKFSTEVVKPVVDVTSKYTIEDKPKRAYEHLIKN